MGMRRPVEVHIEELVLDGFAPADRHRIGEAVERELGRLLAGEEASRLPRRSLAVDAVDAGEFRLPASANARSIGAQVARSVFQGLRAPAPRRTGAR